MRSVVRLSPSSEYRAQLSEYLRNRMIAITPHFAALDGEIVGALLIFHTGSLLNLAKHQASTVQILGAERALFRALKTEHDTKIWADIPHLPCQSSATEALKGKARVISYCVRLDTPQLIYMVDSVCGGKKDWALRGRQFAYGRRRKSRRRGQPQIGFENPWEARAVPTSAGVGERRDGC